MNTRKFTSTLSSLSYVLVLIVLAGAFAWLLGAYFLRPVQLSSPIRATNIPGISISTPTSEPAVSPEINDPSQIISVLEGLAKKNMILFYRQDGCMSRCGMQENQACFRPHTMKPGHITRMATAPALSFSA